MVVGDRLSSGLYSHENKRRFHDFGNLFVRRLINLLFRTRLTDVMSGYRAFSRPFVKTIPVSSGGFEIETELTLHALDKKFLITEVPIKYRDRPEGSVSKLSTFKDGYNVLVTILRIFKDYKPMRFFSFISLLSFIAGLCVGTPVILEYYKTHFVTLVPSAVLAVGLVLLATISLSSGLILDTMVKHNRDSYELYLNSYHLARQNPKKNSYITLVNEESAPSGEADLTKTL
jgi:hypothetical protein